jgi:transcriptional regulator with XRE-family HTH domain
MTKQTDLPRDRHSSATNKGRPTAADIRIGESIRAYRLIAGISQNDLAKQLGLSFQQVQKYEKGANRIGAGRLPQIAEILGIPVGALFGSHAEAAPGSGKASAAPVKLITDPSVLKLLTAYAGIGDRSIRRCLSELVELVAKSEKRSSRR